jgi:hypothetical protein
MVHRGKKTQSSGTAVQDSPHVTQDPAQETDIVDSQNDQTIIAVRYPSPLGSHILHNELRSDVNSAKHEPSTPVTIYDLGKVDQSIYQNLLKSILAQTCSESLIKDVASTQGYLESPTSLSEGRSSVLSESLVNRGESDLQMKRLERRGQSKQRLPTPSRFSITSVDPLHFLGIELTAQNGQLLYACKCRSHALSHWTKRLD